MSNKMNIVKIVPFNSLYLFRILVSEFTSSEPDEKGTSCKSGAVPAAVNPIRRLAD